MVGAVGAFLLAGVGVPIPFFQVIYFIIDISYAIKKTSLFTTFPFTSLLYPCFFILSLFLLFAKLYIVALQSYVAAEGLFI
jgi:hypothetical protein